MKVKAIAILSVFAALFSYSGARAQNFINPYDRPLVDLSSQGLPPQIVVPDPTFNPVPTSTAGQIFINPYMGGYLPHFGSSFGSGFGFGSPLGFSPYNYSHSFGTPYFSGHIGSSLPVGLGLGLGLGLGGHNYGFNNYGFNNYGFNNYGSMGWGYRPGWGSLSGGGIPSSGRLSSTRVIQTAPSKASGNYYAPSTADSTASGSYYSSTPYSGNYQTFEPRKKSVDRDYWGSSGSPYPKDLNSVPWSK